MKKKTNTELATELVQDVKFLNESKRIKTIATIEKLLNTIDALRQDYDRHKKANDILQQENKNWKAYVNKLRNEDEI